MRRLVVVLSLALLAACGAGSSAPEKATTTEPPRAYTVGELRSALPAKGEVPTAAKKVRTCPGDKICQKDTVSVDFDLRPPGDEAEVARLKKAAFVGDYTSVAASLERDAKAATAHVAKSRRTMDRYDGSFDIKLKSTGKTYRPGEKGTGTVEDLTVKGWRGFQVSRVQKFSGYDSDGKTIDFNSTKYDLTYLQVADGRAVLTVYVAVAAAPRMKGASSTLALQLAADYVERLG
jgi:hypothetical protein